ncbi:hypothetical protein EV363DRAFT_1071751, partial [Boletus edulis]
MRLRVRAQNRDFVSSAVKVDGQSVDRMTHGSSVHWSWNDDAQFPRPSFDDDEEFEIEIERRFLLWYKCIRRTQRTSIDQIRTGDREYYIVTIHPHLRPSLRDSALRSLNHWDHNI